MKGYVKHVLAVLALSTFATAAPTFGIPTAPSSVYNIPGDPKYMTKESVLKAAIVCPSPGKLDQKKTVLLVPGTGEPTISFYQNNFGTLLPQNGFPVCYLVIPSLSLGDAQITSEFVAYAVNSLSKSINSKVRVLTHSQGGLNMQWALTFFPSTRSKVYSFFAIAADYKGTIITAIADLLTTATEGGSRPSVIQQGSGSNYIKALARHGGIRGPFVPTSNVYTYTDEVVEPEQIPATATSYLNGAVNIAVQQICPVVRVDDHFLVVTDVITQYFALQAFSSSTGVANPASVDAATRLLLCANVLPSFTSVGGALQYGVTDLITALNVAIVVGADKTLVEPPLFSYAR